MKKIMNFVAFILIVGFVGAWECGSCDFKTMLLNCGITLSVLLLFHTFRTFVKMSKELKRLKRHRIKHVKIS